MKINIMSFDVVMYNVFIVEIVFVIFFYFSCCIYEINVRKIIMYDNI